MSDWSIEVDGVFKDFNTDLDFLVTTSYGTGIPPIQNLTSPMALQPGSVFEGQKIKERPFKIRGSIVAEGSENKTDVHDKRQALLKAIQTYPTSIRSPLPTRRLRYSGATVTKDIYAVYDGGLEDEPPGGWSEEDLDIRFLATDPLFYATSETTSALDSNDSASFTAVLAQLDGVYDNLGPPSASGTYTNVLAIAEDDTYIYVGGDFLNFNNIAAADYIVRWNKSTETWSALSALNGAVYGLDVDGNGDLLVCGTFTNAGGVAAADYIAKWDGSWNALGTPGSGATVTDVYDIKVGTDGNVYVTGNFTNLAGIAAADYVAYWDGSSWNAMSTGLSGAGKRLAINKLNGDVYICGTFTTAGGTTVNRVTYWDGSAFNAMDSGLDSGTAFAVLVASDGLVYVGGTFTAASGTTVNYITRWNGSSWSAMAGGLNQAVYALYEHPETQDIYVAGFFTGTADGTLSVLQARAAIWNGSQWAYLDIDFSSGTPFVTAIHIRANGDVFLGGDFDALIAAYAGSTTINYTGTYLAYPYIEIDRSGGTSATVKGITNAATDARLLMNYDLLDGEMITIEMRPSEGIGITSSKFGNIPNAILANSNLAQFFLTPDNTTGTSANVITCFVDGAGSPTITANLKYKATYLSLD